MPRVNGKQCLVEIKSYPKNKSIPVVIYSTSSEIRDLVEVQRLGAEAYIVKSSSIKDLVAALRDFFQREPEVD
jgi:DNA-binding NarL/FixJ family response regulator